MEACVEVKPLSQAISKGPQTHAWPLEALQNAAPVSQISITLLEIIGDWLRIPYLREWKILFDQSPGMKDSL